MGIKENTISKVLPGFLAWDEEQRRQEEESRRSQIPAELPLYEEPLLPQEPEKEKEKEDSGRVIIQLW